MPKSIREYHRPSDLIAAQELLRRPQLVPLLLGPRVPDDVYEGAEAVVDLSRLDLNYIRADHAGTLHIGALTPLSALSASRLIQSHAGGILATAAHLAAASGLREVATVGGALLAQAGPAEVRLALEALRAEPVWEQTLPIEIRLPALPAGANGALERITRAPRDEAIVAVVAVVHGPTAVRLSVGPAPIWSGDVPLGAMEQALEAWEPVSDFRASADYRRAMAGVLARRALDAAHRRSS